VAALVSIAVLMPAVATAAPASQPAFDGKLFQALEYRNIGPYRGGRVTAVSGVVQDRLTFYMGSTGGGVWKTTDGGVTWRPVSDGQLWSASVGAIAVAPSDPNVIYAGMGSACVRGNTSPGDGVYRSTDAGETWSHAGLRQAGQFGRIRVHPNDPDLAYAAALGHAFGPNEERGVFRTRDGGASWEKVLYVTERTGAVDLAMDPSNPRILYAAAYRMERKPWTAIGGGDGSGLYKSVDGGDTWEEITVSLKGVEGPVGRIGVSVSAAAPNRIYALVEAEGGGLFRSDDRGKTFRLINPDRNLRQRPWYYTHVFADPQDPETVWVLNVGIWRSTDGGRTFDIFRAPHGDHHALWIHPEDSNLLINGNDGGANVSYNGGRTWSTQANQPTAEFYRVTVDDRFPYHVYGCQQDNSCVAVASRTAGPVIDRQDWYVIGGCESGHVAVDPRDPRITYSGCYGGSLARYDHGSGHEWAITTYPEVAVGQAARDLRYRFQWNAPTRLSPHDPDVLYHTSQYVHRSTDGGHSWTLISPDLTRNDVAKQGHAGGDLTWDNTGVEVYGTIFAFEESSHTPGLLWAGTDDGRVHLSRDGGQSWNEITPRGMPEWGTVNMIDLSAHDAGRAFIAVHRYREDDFTPYVFRTDDYGQSWKRLTDGKNGVPTHHFVRVVREDPERRGLLFAGTEFGVYVSFDDGERWQPLQIELPVTPITDLAVKHGDLIVATQGRSFWILDDLSPLRQMSAEVAAADAHLFTPREAYRFGGGFSFSGPRVAGTNPPSGAMIFYTLNGEVEDEVRLEILDAGGEVLRRFSSETEERRAPMPFLRYLPVQPEPRLLPGDDGLNRFVWDLRLPDPELVDDAVLWGFPRGPKVAPGVYQARLAIGDWSQTRSFRVLADPRLAASQEEFDAQYRLARRVWQALTDDHRAIRRLRDVRIQLGDLVRRLEDTGQGDGLREPADSITARLDDLEARLTQPKSEAPQDILNFPPGIDGQLLGLMNDVGGDAAAPPTAGAVERYDDLRRQLDGYLGELEDIFGTQLAAFNDLVTEKGADPVIVGRP
jgi:photosystem II stability/assembly factor-like uncharacterized protein